MRERERDIELSLAYDRTRWRVPHLGQRERDLGDIVLS